VGENSPNLVTLKTEHKKCGHVNFEHFFFVVVVVKYFLAVGFLQVRWLLSQSGLQELAVFP
jgi:hypothetical protein